MSGDFGGADEIAFERQGRAGIVTLTRPEALNALTQRMVSALAAALDAWRDDAAVELVIVRAEGRAFCAGGDVEQMQAGLSYQDLLNDQTAAHEFTRLLRDIPKVTVAAINGPAFGAGLALALATDLRIASDAASFGTAFASVGLDGDLGISWTLPKLIGEAKAKEMMFLPGKIDAHEAARIGLVNFVAAAQDFEAERDTLTARLAASPMNALRFMKQNINAAHSESFAKTLDRETTSHISLMNDPDFHEGVQAFLERRKPEFGRKP